MPSTNVLSELTLNVSMNDEHSALWSVHPSGGNLAVVGELHRQVVVGHMHDGHPLSGFRRRRVSVQRSLSAHRSYRGCGKTENLITISRQSADFDGRDRALAGGVAPVVDNLNTVCT